MNVRLIALSACAILLLTGCSVQSSEDLGKITGVNENNSSPQMDSEIRIINSVDWPAKDGDLVPQLVAESEPAGLREDGSGAFRTHCIESHEGYDDPLISPGAPGQSHHHIFFGNPTVDAYTSIDSLKFANATTCDGIDLNKSAYWVPALYSEFGERIRYIDPLFYYKTGYHVPAEEVVPMPEGLRMIAGTPSARSSQDLEVTKFRCESWTAPEPQFSAGDPLDHIALIPDCEEGDIVEMRLVFPQCWDGENLTSVDHKSHMAYPIPAQAPNVGTGYCPETHPVAIPEISYNFSVRVTEDTGSPQEWRFSPNSGDVPAGATFHGDWMNGWDTDTMETIVGNCLNEARECVVGLLGNGSQLRPVPLEGE